VSMKVLVEENQILPVRIMLELVRGSMNRPQSVTVAQKRSSKPPRDLLRNLPQCKEGSRACRTFDFVIFTEIVVELLKRFDDQEVHWKPDGTSPVGIPAKQAGARFSRLVFEPMLGRAEPQHVRMIFVVSRNGPYPIRR